MLANFTIYRIFNKLRVTLVVDCVRKEADIALTYERRLRASQRINFDQVRTPELAEAWLSRPSESPELGNMVETWEHQYRMRFGIGAAA